MKKKFCEWIEKFIIANKIDKLDVLEIERNGKNYCFTIGQVVECIKLIDSQEQQAIKNMLEEISEDKEEIKDYFTCLAVGFINTIEDETVEENEEAM